MKNYVLRKQLCNRNETTTYIYVDLHLVNVSFTRSFAFITAHNLCRHYLWIILYYTGCPPKNAPTLQCHIFKNIRFDVFQIFAVI